MIPPSKTHTASAGHPIRVVLADDHALVRAGIRALLEKIEGVEVVAEAGDGLKALELVRDLSPDILLLDISMPGLTGLEVLKETQANYPTVRVILLSVHGGEDYAMHALRSGACGFLPKSAASEELEVALTTVANGENYFSPETRDRDVEGSVRLTELTPRQREVLKMIASGKSTKDIAHTLDISAKTVETHRAQLMERLQIHDVAGLVRYAIRTGLVNLDE